MLTRMESEENVMNRKKRNLSERSNQSIISPQELKRKTRLPSDSLQNVSVGDIREFFTPNKMLKDKSPVKNFKTSKSSINKEKDQVNLSALKKTVDNTHGNNQSKAILLDSQVCNLIKTNSVNCNTGSARSECIETLLKDPSIKIKATGVKPRFTVNRLVYKAKNISTRRNSKAMGLKGKSKPTKLSSPQHQVAEQHQLYQEDEQAKMDTQIIGASAQRAVSIEMVMAMFQRLEKKVDEIANKGISQEAQEEINSEALKSVDFITEPILQENTELRIEVNRCKHQNQVLTGIVHQLTNKIKDLQVKVENCEITNAKKCVTLSNFED